jgi:hypothetical protein
MALSVAVLQAAFEYGGLTGAMSTLKSVSQQAVQWGQQHVFWVVIIFVGLLLLLRLFRPKW